MELYLMTSNIVLLLARLVILPVKKFEQLIILRHSSRLWGFIFSEFTQKFSYKEFS